MCWGDRNITRFSYEKSSDDHTTTDILAFSDWINSQSFLDLNPGGARLALSNHQNPPSLLCLDYLLVSKEWLDLFPEVGQLALWKPTLDH